MIPIIILIVSVMLLIVLMAAIFKESKVLWGLLLFPLAGFGFYLFCLNHVDVNEMGIAFNSWDGEVSTQERPGWYRTSPFVKVAYVSLLPQVVHIPSQAKVINTKIVRFKPEGTKQFVEIQGWSYSMNSGLNNVLMGFAFSGQKFDFIEIVQEGGLENMTPVRK